ncbi:MAG: ComF family protein [Massilia sp.]
MPERPSWWPHRWPQALAGALLPSTCALCGMAGADVVCGPCHAHYVAPRRPRCSCCANPLEHSLPEKCALTPVLKQQFPENRGQSTFFEKHMARSPLCGGCLAERPAFDATVVAADYASPLDQLVLQLKFGGRLALAPWFARMLRDALLAQPGFRLPDLLCPVPLGPRRLVERGFNQALEIARPLAGSLGVALHPRLALRALDTRAQSGVSPSERRDNIRGAFEVAPDAFDRVQGRHVGIVDDVMTSGHTLDELAATLKQAGAARVSGLVFARTPPH